MTQFQHTLRPLLLGKKTETSRIVKEGQEYAGALPHAIPLVYQWDKGVNRTRTLWQVGKDYAIVPRRGVKSVGRYRVEKIWRQDVRTLTLGQVDAEGFNVLLWTEFWVTWCKMHDPSMVAALRSVQKENRSHVDARNVIANRPAERYQAWRMTISVLWDTVDWDAPAVRALQIEPHGAILKETF